MKVLYQGRFEHIALVSFLVYFGDLVKYVQHFLQTVFNLVGFLALGFDFLFVFFNFIHKHHLKVLRVARLERIPGIKSLFVLPLLFLPNFHHNFRHNLVDICIFFSAIR